MGKLEGGTRYHRWRERNRSSDCKAFVAEGVHLYLDAAKRPLMLHWQELGAERTKCSRRYHKLGRS